MEPVEEKRSRGIAIAAITVAILVCVLCLIIAYLSNDAILSRLASLTETTPESSPQTDNTGSVNGLNYDEPTQAYAQVKVVSVVDGDTIKLDYDGTTETVRLIGIDTPETGAGNTTPECFAGQAKAKLTELITGKEVFVAGDSSQQERDRYGRLLLYIWTAEPGKVSYNLINYYLISAGYAHEYTYSVPYRYQAEFKAAQTYAQNHKLGLWGDICTPEATTSPNQSPQFSCNCERTCGQMTCAEAKFQLNQCRCYDLDKDQDGKVCEGKCSD